MKVTKIVPKPVEPDVQITMSHGEARLLVGLLRSVKYDWRRPNECFMRYAEEDDFRHVLDDILLVMTNANVHDTSVEK